MSDSTPSSTSPQLPLKPLVPCMRQPAYGARLLVRCEDADCPVRSRTHYVYIKSGGDDPYNQNVWHLDMVRHLPDHIRCPESFDFEWVDIQLWEYNITLTFPGYTRTGTRLPGGKRGHGPMVGNDYYMEDLNWRCPYCDSLVEFEWSYNNELLNKCYCGYERDATCVKWEWKRLGHNWDDPILVGSSK